MSLVFFDFDGTLIRRDSILPFGTFVASSRPSKHLRFARLLLLLALLKGRVISNHVFKERLCALLLKGESEAAMDRVARAFAETRLIHMLNDPVVDALRRHRQQHDDVYLVSSNFSLVMRPFEKLWNAQGVIATEPRSCTAGSPAGYLAARVMVRRSSPASWPRSAKRAFEARQHTATAAATARCLAM